MRFVNFEAIQENGSMKLSEHLNSEQRENSNLPSENGLD